MKMSGEQDGCLIPFPKVLPKLENSYGSDHLPALSHSLIRGNGWIPWRSSRPIGSLGSPGKPRHGGAEQMDSAGSALPKGTEGEVAQRALVPAPWFRAPAQPPTKARPVL